MIIFQGSFMTQKESINPAYKKMILDAMNYHFPNAKVYLFGSRARKTHEEGADVDIAIDDQGKKISYHEIIRARSTLDNLLIPLEVDLVDLHAIPEELKKTILEEGELWRD